MKKQVLAYAIATMLLFTTVACVGDDPEDTARVPSSSSGFEGEDYNDVVDDLKDAGFTNVVTEALGDLITGWITKEDSVEEVEIDGDTEFSSNSRHLKNVEIVITYHSFPVREVEPPEPEATQEATEAPPEPEPQTESAPSTTLDEAHAAQYLALAWEDRMTYGGTVHWIMDRITTANADGTYTFKIGATIKNAYGTKYSGTIEGDVGGTNDLPIVLDSIMYTDAGEIVNYYG